jgi:endoglucanase Acf2
MVSMVWGAKAVYETWFSADPITKHGINILPVQSGSLYLGHDPEYVRRNVAGLAAERIAADGKDPKRAPNAPPRVGPNWGGWGDIILMYQALSDAAAAIRDCDFDKQEIEGGNSRANLYHWMHFLDKVGHVDASVTADTPLYAVFNKGGRRTYVVYSAVEEPRRVTFSDGAVVATARRGLHVK